MRVLNGQTRSVNEDALLAGMCVDIDKHLDLSLLVPDRVPNVVLDVLHFSHRRPALVLLVGEEAPVHVLALQVASVVANNHAVGVGDGHDPKFKLISDLHCLWILRNQVIYQTLNYITRMGLARMLAP